MFLCQTLLFFVCFLKLLPKITPVRQEHLRLILSDHHVSLKPGGLDLLSNITMQVMSTPNSYKIFIIGWYYYNAGPDIMCLQSI